MTRHLLTIYSPEDRARAMQYIRSAPAGTRLELKSIKRSLPQNDCMWSMLSDVSAQATHNGRKYTPEVWKSIFLHALGREMQFVPSLDNSMPIPLGLSSSDLSREEMTALIDLIDAWCAQNGVTLHGPQQQAVA